MLRPQVVRTPSYAVPVIVVAQDAKIPHALAAPVAEARVATRAGHLVAPGRSLDWDLALRTALAVWCVTPRVAVLQPLPEELATLARPGARHVVVPRALALEAPDKMAVLALKFRAAPPVAPEHRRCGGDLRAARAQANVRVVRLDDQQPVEEVLLRLSHVRTHFLGLHHGAAVRSGTAHAHNTIRQLGTHVLGHARLAKVPQAAAVSSRTAASTHDHLRFRQVLVADVAGLRVAQVVIGERYAQTRRLVQQRTSALRYAQRRGRRAKAQVLRQRRSDRNGPSLDAREQLRGSQKFSILH